MCAAKPGIETDRTLFQRLGEQTATALQPGSPRGGVFPGGEGGGVGEAKDDLELVVSGRRGEDAGAEVAGEVGGELLTIECANMPGKGNIIRTGSLGDVMKESVEAARSVVRARSRRLGIKDEAFEKTDIHIHVPEGATPKDGPSAGIGIVTAITSSLTGIPVRADVAMTGEITLRGQVLPIGGLKEKLLAAHRGGIKTVLIPYENKRDLEEIPDNVIADLQIHPVKRIEEVLSLALQNEPSGMQVVTAK